jgi:hypothetical protein
MRIDGFVNVICVEEYLLSGKGKKNKVGIISSPKILSYYYYY